MAKKKKERERERERNDQIIFRSSKRNSMNVYKLCLRGKGRVLQVDKKMHPKERENQCLK